MAGVRRRRGRGPNAASRNTATPSCLSPGHEERLAAHGERVRRYFEANPSEGGARGETDLGLDAVEALIDEADSRTWRFD
ncbi:MAG: hypothetical protein KAI24_19870 [Planctomycetes bacterium]|nr:hypothetical protein [Planctomycetota bacterium]